MNILILLLLSFTILGIEKGDPVMLQVISKNVRVPSDFKDGVEEILTFNDNSLIDENQQEETLKIQVKQRKTDCYDNECLVDVGKMLAARGLIIVEVSKSGTLYKFKAKIIDFETGSTQRTKVLYYKNKLNNGKKLNIFGKKLISELLNLKRNNNITIIENEYTESESDFNMESNNQYLVNFSSTPQKAIVLVDGSLLCQETPCSKMLNSGNHKVVIQKVKYEKLIFNLNVNKELSINKNLTYSFGYLTVISNIKNARIKIDDKVAGTTPINNYELSKGIHKIEVNDKCFYKSVKIMNIKKGEKRIVNFNIKNRKSGIKILVTDDKKNVLRGKLYIDDKYMGKIPGTYKIYLCSKIAEIKTQKGNMKIDLSLKEDEIFVLSKMLISGTCKNGMCYIPAGMELPAFWIDQYEVTVAEFRKCVNAGKCNSRNFRAKDYNGSYAKYYNYGKFERDNHPMNGVNWYGAKEYCEWAGKRLPTEAEWVYAAYGTDGRKYPWGNEKANCDYAIMFSDTYSGCGKGLTWEVGSKPLGKSPFGVYDMAGNVWEWVEDCSDCNFDSHALHGGGWYNKSYYLRSSHRFKVNSFSMGINYGFRCVK